MYAYGMRGLEPGLILFLEVFLSFIIGRSAVRNSLDLEKVVKLLAILFVVLAPFAIMESMSGYRFTHIVAARVMGTGVIENLGEGYFRYGVHRASTIFSHPILYSICTAMLVPLVFVTFKKFRLTLYSSGLFVAIVTSMSSVGFLMIIIQSLFWTVEHISFKFKGIKKLIVIFSLFSFVLISLISNRGPVKLFISLVSLNQETAYMRYLQWQFSIDDIVSSPWVGIGFNEWTRPYWMQSSIDNYWLNTALVSGVPAIILLFLFFTFCTQRLYHIWNKTKNPLVFSFFLSLVSVIFAGFTVDFFDRAQLFIFLGIGMFIGYSENTFKQESASN